MSQVVASLFGPAVALVAAAWAGLLVMLQEHPDAGRGTTPAPSHAGADASSTGAIQVGRLALLLLAGFAASDAVKWWYQPLDVGLGRVAVALGFVYLLAEGLPRSAAALVPGLAATLVPLARMTLSPFVPLGVFAKWAERILESLLPAPVKAADRFGKAHSDMLHGVFTLGETAVSDVMTPRLDIQAVDSRADWREVVDLLSKSEQSRIIVYTDDLDNVEGVLFAKDLTPAVAGVTDPPSDWHEFVRPALFVPESKVLTAQLRDFQNVRSGLAVVVDEFGGTSGLITLEDVLEEIVGEIHGEYDVDAEPAVEMEGDDKFWVDGRLSLDDLSELLGQVVEREDVSTVGGLVYSELGRVPKPGEEFQLKGYRVVVEQIIRRRVRRVYFERLTQSPAAGAADEEEE